MKGGVRLSPQVCLLNDQGYGGKGKRRAQAKYLIGHLLTAARLLLAKKRKSEELPTEEERRQKVQYM